MYEDLATLMKEMSYNSGEEPGHIRQNEHLPFLCKNVSDVFPLVAVTIGQSTKCSVIYFSPEHNSISLLFCL